MSSHDEQEAQIAEAARCASAAVSMIRKVHGELTAQQHTCERRLSYAYDCLSDAIGYLADAKTFVKGGG